MSVLALIKSIVWLEFVILVLKIQHTEQKSLFRPQHHKQSSNGATNAMQKHWRPYFRRVAENNDEDAEGRTTDVDIFNYNKPVGYRHEELSGRTNSKNTRVEIMANDNFDFIMQDEALKPTRRSTNFINPIERDMQLKQLMEELVAKSRLVAGGLKKNVGDGITNVTSSENYIKENLAQQSLLLMRKSTESGGEDKQAATGIKEVGVEIEHEFRVEATTPTANSNENKKLNADFQLIKKKQNQTETDTFVHSVPIGTSVKELKNNVSSILHKNLMKLEDNSYDLENQAQKLYTSDSNKLKNNEANVNTETAEELEKLNSYQTSEFKKMAENNELINMNSTEYFLRNNTTTVSSNEMDFSTADQTTEMENLEKNKQNILKELELQKLEDQFQASFTKIHVDSSELTDFDSEKLQNLPKLYTRNHEIEKQQQQLMLKGPLMHEQYTTILYEDYKFSNNGQDNDMNNIELNTQKTLKEIEDVLKKKVQKLEPNTQSFIEIETTTVENTNLEFADSDQIRDKKIIMQVEDANLTNTHFEGTEFMDLPFKAEKTLTKLNTKPNKHAIVEEFVTYTTSELNPNMQHPEDIIAKQLNKTVLKTQLDYLQVNAPSINRQEDVSGDSAELRKNTQEKNVLNGIKNEESWELTAQLKPTDEEDAAEVSTTPRENFEEVGETDLLKSNTAKEIEEMTAEELIKAATILHNKDILAELKDVTTHKTFELTAHDVEEHVSGIISNDELKHAAVTTIQEEEVKAEEKVTENFSEKLWDVAYRETLEDTVTAPELLQTTETTKEHMITNVENSVSAFEELTTQETKRLPIEHSLENSVEASIINDGSTFDTTFIKAAATANNKQTLALENDITESFATMQAAVIAGNFSELKEDAAVVMQSPTISINNNSKNSLLSSSFGTNRKPANFKGNQVKEVFSIVPVLYNISVTEGNIERQEESLSVDNKQYNEKSYMFLSSSQELDDNVVTTLRTIQNDSTTEFAEPAYETETVKTDKLGNNDKESEKKKTKITAIGINGLAQSQINENGKKSDNLNEESMEEFESMLQNTYDTHDIESPSEEVIAAQKTDFGKLNSNTKAVLGASLGQILQGTMKSPMELTGSKEKAALDIKQMPDYKKNAAWVKPNVSGTLDSLPKPDQTNKTDSIHMAESEFVQNALQTGNSANFMPTLATLMENEQQLVEKTTQIASLEKSVLKIPTQVATKENYVKLITSVKTAADHTVNITSNAATTIDKIKLPLVRPTENAVRPIPTKAATTISELEQKLKMESTTQTIFSMDSEKHQSEQQKFEDKTNTKHKVENISINTNANRTSAEDMQIPQDTDNNYYGSMQLKANAIEKIQEDIIATVNCMTATTAKSAAADNLMVLGSEQQNTRATTAKPSAVDDNDDDDDDFKNTENNQKFIAAETDVDDYRYAANDNYKQYHGDDDLSTELKLVTWQTYNDNNNKGYRYEEQLTAKKQQQQTLESIKMAVHDAEVEDEVNSQQQLESLDGKVAGNDSATDAEDENDYDDDADDDGNTETDTDAELVYDDNDADDADNADDADADDNAVDADDDDAAAYANKAQEAVNEVVAAAAHDGIDSDTVLDANRQKHDDIDNNVHGNQKTLSVQMVHTKNAANDHRLGYADTTHYNGNKHILSQPDDKQEDVDVSYSNSSWWNTLNYAEIRKFLNTIFEEATDGFYRELTRQTRVPQEEDVTMSGTDW